MELAYDAFRIDSGMGPMTYLTGDGRVLLDMRGWFGESIQEATEDEAIAALVLGAEKTSIPGLLDLIPQPPPNGVPCPGCSGTRWCSFKAIRIVCLLCRGRGWSTTEAIASACADVR